MTETPQAACPAAHDEARSAVTSSTICRTRAISAPVLRSAAAAGIRQVYGWCAARAAWRHGRPKCLRAGMGAHFILKIVEDADLHDLLRTSALPVLATSSHAEQTLYQLDLRQPQAWLFGHEGQGVAPELLALATYRVAIPHLGNVESLNVAACAAVCFFEQVRQKTSQG